jgi:prevent-host-death family protein
MIDEMIRREWREIVETVKSGTNIVVSIDNRPEVAVIPYEDYLALQEQLEDLQDLRLAEAAYDEYLRDPTTARPFDEVVAEWHAQDAATDDNKAINR